MKATTLPGLKQIPALELIRRVNQGLPLSEFEALRAMLAVSKEKLCELVGISMPTLSRRQKDGGDLDAQCSEKLVRYARLHFAATDLFDAEETSARAWLRAPARALGGATPLDFARTEIGAREVEALIHKLEHTVYV